MANFLWVVWGWIKVPDYRPIAILEPRFEAQEYVYALPYVISMKRFLAYFFGGSKENKTIDGDRVNRNKKLSSNNNWIGPDGTESGPDVPEDWYLTYDGPKPIVEEIYEPNYSVDRGKWRHPHRLLHQ